MSWGSKNKWQSRGSLMRKGVSTKKIKGLISQPSNRGTEADKTPSLGNFENNPLVVLQSARISLTSLLIPLIVAWTAAIINASVSFLTLESHPYRPNFRVMISRTFLIIIMSSTWILMLEKTRVLIIIYILIISCIDK